MNSIVSSVVSLVMGAASAPVPSCPLFQDLIPTVHTADAFEYQAANDKKLAAEDGVVARVANEFLSGSHRFSEYLPCIEAYDESNRFLLSFQSQVIAQSLSRLRSAQSPRIREFAARVDAKSADGRNLTFRFTGHGFGPKPVDKKAGFHRTSQSIFMDLDSLNANEWLVILVHELSHYLDPQIYTGMLSFSNPELVHSVVAMAQTTNNPNQLISTDHALLDQWLMSGLDAGILAEYRAWASTAILYRDGLQEGLWTPVRWMESFNSQIGPAANPWPGIMNYLNKRVLPAKHPLFAWPLVQGELQLRLADLATHPTDLGVFGDLFAHNKRSPGE